MRAKIRQILKNPFLNFGMGVMLWVTSTSGDKLFWSDMMTIQMRVDHGVALLGAWRALKYLPDVIDSFFK